MRTRLMIAAATTAALLAGAAFAQSSGANGSNFSQNQPVGDTSVNPAPANAPPASDSAPPAAPAPIQAPPEAAPPPANLNSSDSATVAPAAGAPTERAPSASAGTDLVSNGPVPDTPENRAKYGQPLSHAGRMTKAKGN